MAAICWKKVAVMRNTCCMICGYAAHAVSGEIREFTDSGSMGLEASLITLDSEAMHISRGVVYAGQSHNTCWLSSSSV